MSDYLSEDEAMLFSDNNSKDEFDVLKSTLHKVFDKSLETWTSITNESNVKIVESSFEVLDKESISFDPSNIYSKLNISDGIHGVALLAIPPDEIKTLANLMMGMMLDEESLEDIEMQQGALTECSNQYFGGMCTLLTRNISDVLNIDSPEFYSQNNLPIDNIIHDISKREKEFIKSEHIISINDVVHIKAILLFTKATASSLIFRIKSTDSKNLLKQNPELSRSIAEYFTLISSKYKAVFSMVGITGNVSVSEINSIHSLQCLDSSIINNYCVSNKVSAEDTFNTYIFEKSFVDEMRALSYDSETGEENYWDILKELNSQFSQIFTQYSSDNKLVFDNVDCETYLNLPDHQYLLISFTVGEYSLHQMISFNLVDKLTFNLTKEDKAILDYKVVDNLFMQQQGLDGESADSSSTNLTDSILLAYKNIPMEVSAILGEKEYLLKDILKFSPGYVIHFDRRVSEDIDVYINNIPKAKGEVGERNINKSNNYAIKLKKFIKEKCL